jgi:gluconolactonase
MNKTKNAFLLFFFILMTVTYSQTKTNINMDIPELIKTGFSFTEGPAVDKDGNVYFTDQPNNKIYIWNHLSNLVTLFHSSPERSNGMHFNNEGKLLACADLYGRIISISMDGSFDILVEGFNGKQLNGPNDLWPRDNGGIYFTDPYYQRPYWEREEPDIPEQRVYYYSPDGKVTIADEDLVKPNGIIGTPDGKTLYVADIEDEKTYMYEIKEDGSLVNKTLFAEEGSDGMTIDAEGNVYLTNDGVSVFDKDGKKITNIEVPELPSNVCFAGKDRDILFITARTSVYKLQMNVKGVE